MATAVRFESTQDTTALPIIVRGSIILGVIESCLVFAVSLTNRMLEGSLNRGISAVLVAIGLAIVLFWPGRLTRARTIEGIAGAAGIGLGAAGVFLLIDVAVLQWLGTYTNRWAQVGGGSNWWYHPVWWMVGTFLPWMGAWILANQTRKHGQPSVPAAIALVAVVAAVLGVLAATLHFPEAGFYVPTFALAVLPAAALSAIITGVGGPKG